MLHVSAQIVFNFISLSISYVISSSISNILYIFITAIFIYIYFMLRSKIENAHWVEKTTTTRCGIRETAATRNCVLWLFLTNHNALWH